MRADDEADFQAYVAARRSTLVRATMLLGAAAPIASAVVDASLDRVRRSWRDVRGSADPDAEVLDELLRTLRRLPDPGMAALEPELADLLDGLVVGLRRTLVLDALLDRPGPALRDGLPDGLPDGLQPTSLREAADALAVPRPGSHALPRTRHPARTPALVVAAVLVAVVAAGTWVGTRPEPPPPPEPRVERVEMFVNLAPVPWWAAGVLHLEASQVRVDDVASFGQVGELAVVATTDGTVSLLDADGELEEIGRTRPGEVLLVEEGWALWVDRTHHELVVYDVASREVLARQALPAGSARPVAVVGHDVFYVDDDGAHVWSLPELRRGPYDLAGAGDLLDVAGRAALVRRDGDVVVYVDGRPVPRQHLGPSAAYPADDARLSPGGTRVLLWAATPAGRQVQLADAGTGVELATGIERGETALAARWVDETTVLYAVARGSDVPAQGEYGRLSFAGPLQLRLCTISALALCRPVTTFSGSAGQPVLGQ